MTVSGSAVTVDVPGRAKAGSYTLSAIVNDRRDTASAPLQVNVVKGRPAKAGPTG